MPEPLTEPDADFLLANKHRKLATYMNSHHKKTIAFFFVCAAFYLAEAYTVKHIVTQPASPRLLAALILAHTFAITLAFFRISQYRKTLFELNILAAKSEISQLGGTNDATKPDSPDSTV